MTLTSSTSGLRYVAVALLALAVGTSTLTFSWPIGEPSDARLFREFAGPVLYLSDVFLLIGLTLWAVNWALAGRPPLNIGPLYVAVPMAVLVGAGLMSALWAVDPLLAMLNGLRLGALFATYVVLVNEYQRASAVVVAALIAFGILHALVAVAQILNDEPLGLTMLGEIVDEPPINFAIKQGRPSGLGFNPNPVGMLLAVASVLSFAAFLQSRRSSLTRAAFIVAFLVTTVGLVATKSRWEIACWLVAMGAVSFLAWRSEPVDRQALRRNIFVPATLVAIILLASFPLLFDEQARKLTPDVFTPKGAALAWEIRVDNWSQSLDVVQQQPFGGVGLGSYPQIFARDTPPDRWGRNVVPVHNLPLLALAEMGPVGAVAMIVLLASPIAWLIAIALGRRAGTRTLWLGPMVIIVLVALLEYYPWATQDGRVLLWAILGLWAGETFNSNPSARDRIYNGERS